MQRVSPLMGTSMSLTQALGPPPVADGEVMVTATVTSVPSGPTLAEERSAILEQARLEGLQAGEAAAAAALQKQLREHSAAHDARMLALAAQQRLLGDLLAAVPEKLDLLEARTLDAAAVLAFAAATRMYGSGAADFRQVCVQLLDEQRERPVVLRVAPAMYGLVEGLADAHVRVESAPGLTAGQAQLQTSSGAADGGVDVRLDAIRTAFLAGLAAQPR
jgi:flagellar assembly protein FliH